jgi:hypothetical protein
LWAKEPNAKKSDALYGHWPAPLLPQVGRKFLFNVKADPHETENLFENPEYAGVAERLTGEMKRGQEMLDGRDPIEVQNPRSGDWKMLTEHEPPWRGGSPAYDLANRDRIEKLRLAQKPGTKNKKAQKKSPEKRD